MLPGQHGGGHQNGGLLAVEHTLHNGPEGHLGLAVAYVPAQQPVHGPGLLHVLLDLGDAAQLVVGLGVLKLVLELLHPRGIRREGKARLPLPLSVELNEPLGQVLHRLFGPGLGFLPIRAPQAGELFGLGGVLPPADVLAHQVQLGSGHIEHVRPGVGQFDVVLLNPVHRHLGHAHIPADAMVLMHHQVAGGKVGIGAQLLPVGHRLGLPFFPPGLRAPLGEHSQPRAGEFHAPGHPAHGDHRFSGGGQLMELEIHGGPYLLLPQQGLEIQGPLLAAHQYHGGIALADIVGQVGHCGLQAGPVGGQLFGQQVQKGAGPAGILGGGKGVQIAHRPLLQSPVQPLKAEEELRQLARQLPPFQQGLYILLHLPQPGTGPLRHPGALGEKHRRVLRQVVRRRGQLRIGQSQIPVHSREGGPTGQPLPVLLQGGQQRSASTPAAPRPGDQTIQLFQQAGPAAGGKLGEHLGGRQDLRLADVLCAPLGTRVEESQGVHLVPEELRPHRPGLGGGKEIQDAAPQGKLAHALHLLAPGVARGGESPGQLGQVAALPHPQHLGGLGEQGLGKGALEQGLHGAHQQGALPRRQSAQHAQPPVLPLAGDHGRVVKGKLPGLQGAHRLAGKGGQVLCHALGLPLVGAHHHHRALLVPAHSGGKIGPMHRTQPGKGRRAPAAVHGGQQALKFRNAVEGG